MTTHQENRTTGRRSKVGLAVLLTLLLVVPQIVALAGPSASKAWRSAAKKLRTAEKAEAKADYNFAMARALMIEDEEEREEAMDEAKEEYKEAKGLTCDVYKARLELAAELGEDDFYRVEIDPDDFLDGVVNHPFMPLVPGTEWVYKATTEDGEETITVTVLSETKEILGVNCVVVRDVVELDGEVIEDTHDWFAQDKDGNVWYMGEIALNYEDGQLTDVDGSWESGRDGAQPGIVMPALPSVGDVYRQEFLLGEAEDYGEVLSLSATASVPAGNFTGCLKTFDGTPMEPDVEEHKYYASGIGVVLEEDLESGERVELIRVTTK